MSPLTEEERQTQKVYMSEIKLNVLYDIEKTDLASCRKFADKLLHSQYVTTTFPNCVSVDIKYLPSKNAEASGRSVEYANGTFGIKIELPPWGKEPLTVLHEFCHGLTPLSEVENHGPEFLMHFIELMQEFMPWMVDEFVEECIRNEVNFN